MLIRKEATAGRSTPAAFGSGAVIGALGGLIGLGGAEFRLPLLIGAFRFAGLQAVILNKAMSIAVVASALPFRATTVPFASVAANWPIIVNLLAGSLLGAWCGAEWATRLAASSAAVARVRAKCRPAAAAGDHPRGVGCEGLEAQVGYGISAAVENGETMCICG